MFGVKPQTNKQTNKGSSSLMDTGSASQPRDHEFKHHTGHDHDSSYDTKYWLVPGSGLESDLNKLWERASQSS